jgi:hypothetical protein
MFCIEDVVNSRLDAFGGVAVAALRAMYALSFVSSYLTLRSAKNRRGGAILSARWVTILGVSATICTTRSGSGGSLFGA